jgi:8-oxo-dGTP pyrophosphatase MutT (NUDIX family)
VAGFRHLGDEQVARLARFEVVRARFAAPDGTEFTRDVVRNPGAVAAVPLLDDGHTALLVRQYRGPVDAVLLELPAGLLDVDGEDPADAMRRELVEEVGRTAASLTELVRAHMSAGFTDHEVTVYLAAGLQEVPTDRQGVEEAHMTVEEVGLHDAPRLVADGTITDGKTIIGLLAAREHLGIR